jgi:mannose-6-phosphate isomerase-like protein (cupin superfamily)
MNRREFSAALPMLLAATGLLEAQAPTSAPASAPMPHALPTLQPGVYPPGAEGGSQPLRRSRHFTVGMLPDNIRMESHFTRLGPGCPPEPIEHHKHSEIWFMHEGEATLMTAGNVQTLKPGDMGIATAGTDHYICNASKTEPCSYFVISVGPPE